MNQNRLAPFVHESGFKGWELMHPAGGSVRILEYGAHLISWNTPAPNPLSLIFMSTRAELRPGSAIRGGIPVCFPQFSKRGQLPSHGFARSSFWRTKSTESGDLPAVTLELTDSDESRKIWPYSFEATLSVSLSERLELVLEVTNRSAVPLELSTALHTYYQIGDINRCAVTGLEGADALNFLTKPEGVPYVEYIEHGERRPEPRKEVTITAPTDCVYPGAPDKITLHDRGRGIAVEIEKSGFDDFVVWNPWSTGNAQLKDLHEDGYTSMICIEPAQASTLATISAGDRREFRTAMRVVR